MQLIEAGVKQMLDAIYSTLDMTERFRPSELFALRWSGFAINARTLMLTQTAYRGKLRDFGKTKKSLRKVHLPKRLANELPAIKRWQPESGPVPNYIAIHARPYPARYPAFILHLHQISN